MDFDKYQHAARQTAIYPDSSMVVYPALGLAGEAGEAANKVKKMLRDGGNLREEVADEIGDVLWYCAALASDIGFSLNDIAKNNVKKLKDRQRRGKLQGSGDNR